MAGQTLTERVATLNDSVVKLTERVDLLRTSVGTMENLSRERDQVVNAIDKRLAILEVDSGRQGSRIDEISSRRWDLWKLVVAALLGAALTLAVGLLGKSLDRPAGEQATPGRR